MLLSLGYDQVLGDVRSALGGFIKGNCWAFSGMAVVVADKIRYKKRAHLTLAKNRLGEEGVKMVDFYRDKL